MGAVSVRLQMGDEHPSLIFPVEGMCVMEKLLLGDTERSPAFTSSPLQRGQWHMAAQLPRALAFQLSPGVVQWMDGGAAIRGLAEARG